MPRMYQQYKVMADAASEMDEALSKSRSVSRFLFWCLALSVSVNAVFCYLKWVA